jgi:hypothetical protein
LTTQLSGRIKIPAAFWAGLRALGLNNTADLIRQARLPLAVLTDQVVVTTSQYFAIWQAMYDLTGDAAIGIKFGLFGLWCGLASQLTKFRTDLLRSAGPDGPDNEPGSPAPADPLHRNAAGAASGIRRHVRFVRILASLAT